QHVDLDVGLGLRERREVDANVVLLECRVDGDFPRAHAGARHEQRGRGKRLCKRTPNRHGDAPRVDRPVHRKPRERASPPAARRRYHGRLAITMRNVGMPTASLRHGASVTLTPAWRSAEAIRRGGLASVTTSSIAASGATASNCTTSNLELSTSSSDRSARSIIARFTAQPAETASLIAE